MAIPDYQSIMLPLLRLSATSGAISIRNAVEELAKVFDLTDEELATLLPSGRQAVFNNRVAWAKTYLMQAGLLEATTRGVFRLTGSGSKFLESNPDKVNVKTLEQFPKFIEFRSRAKKDENQSDSFVADEEEKQQTPQELMESLYLKTRNGLATELLDIIKSCSPSFFEQLVVDLIVAMGYGGSYSEAGKALGKSGDGGIDGIVKEDKLGLDIIYLQAKRWEGTVGRPEIQKFAGALEGQRASKGIFITTSGFTREAAEYVSLIRAKIILIDGMQLSNYMINHNVGISNSAVYEMKRIDFEYFNEA